jgi:hypothetical protein
VADSLVAGTADSGGPTPGVIAVSGGAGTVLVVGGMADSTVEGTIVGGAAVVADSLVTGPGSKGGVATSFVTGTGGGGGGGGLGNETPRPARMSEGFRFSDISFGSTLRASAMSVSAAFMSPVLPVAAIAFI